MLTVLPYHAVDTNICMSYYRDVNCVGHGSVQTHRTFSVNVAYEAWKGIQGKIYTELKMERKFKWPAGVEKIGHCSQAW